MAGRPNLEKSDKISYLKARCNLFRCFREVGYMSVQVNHKSLNSDVLNPDLKMNYFPDLYLITSSALAWIKNTLERNVHVSTFITHKCSQPYL